MEKINKILLNKFFNEIFYAKLENFDEALFPSRNHVHWDDGKNCHKTARAAFN